MKIKDTAEAILALMKECGDNKAAGEVGNWDALSAQLNNIMQNLVNAHAARHADLQPIVREAANVHQANTRRRKATAASSGSREIRFTGADFQNAKKGLGRKRAAPVESQPEPAEVEVPSISTSNDNMVEEFLNTPTTTLMVLHGGKEPLEGFVRVFVPDFSFNARLKDEEKMVAQAKEALRGYLERLKGEGSEEEE